MIKIIKKWNRQEACDRCISAGGQVVMEFSFAMILMLLLVWGTIQIFRWSGVDLAERRIAHDQALTQGIIKGWGGCITFVNFVCTEWSTVYDGQLKQLDPFFYASADMNAVWTGGGMGLVPPP